ncbi:MAG: adenosine deaminase [Clostridiaceae bacterium]
MEIYNKLHRLPKVELHLHLDGSVRGETMWELLKASGEEVPFDNYEDFEKIIGIKGKCSSLKEYLESFQYPIKIMQTKDNLTRISRELMEDLAKDGVIYAEVRFAPYFHQEKGLTIEEVIEAVLEGLSQGEKMYGVRSRLILCAMRGFPEDKNMELIKRCTKFLNSGVAAADLAGNEHDFPPEESREVFEVAKKSGYHVTIHAGETGKEENIEKSINITGAERIGHGVFAYKNPDVISLIKDKNIFLEMCPTSNVNTNAVNSIGEHPIRQYFLQGIKVTVSTDNRTVSRISLTEEMNKLIKEAGFTLEDVVILTKYAAEGAFCDESTRLWIISRIEDWSRNEGIS